MNLSQYLDNIQKKLQYSFDIERNYVINNYKYDLFGKYLLRNERYVLVKKATIYAIENNEYCLIKYFDELDKNNLQEFIESLKKAVDVIVKPSNDHMSSIITGVIVTDNRTEFDLEKIIERFKFQKGFAFGFKGWADIRLVLVTLNEKFVITNKKGKEVSKVYSI